VHPAAPAWATPASEAGYQWKQLFLPQAAQATVPGSGSQKKGCGNGRRGKRRAVKRHPANPR